MVLAIAAGAPALGLAGHAEPPWWAPSHKGWDCLNAEFWSVEASAERRMEEGVPFMWRMKCRRAVSCLLLPHAHQRQHLLQGSGKTRGEYVTLWAHEVDNLGMATSQRWPVAPLL